MTIREMLLLTVVALAAVAFAAPASASANPLTWKDNGVVLKPKEHATLTFTGQFYIEYLASLNTFSCETNITLTAEGGHTGTITKVEVKTDKCTATGKFANCTLEDDEIKNLPLVVHTTTTDFEITGAILRFKFVGGTGCAYSEANLIFKNITATPNKLDPIGSITLFGVDVVGTSWARGTLNAASPNTLGLG